MKKSALAHEWRVTIPEARAIQESLRKKLVMVDRFATLRKVAGVDVGFEKRSGQTRAAVVVLDIDGLSPIAHAVALTPTHFPYVPGYLSFREVPAILEALRRLPITPDIMLCDGQGYAHPRRFGLACHLGVLTDIPCIGVAKTRLVGSHDCVPETRGGWVALRHAEKGAAEETIGAVLRTRAGVKPIFVSVGHRVSLDTAVATVMRCTTRYRLPETTRHAHRLASNL